MLSNRQSTCAIWRFKIDRTVLVFALILGLCAVLAGLSLVYSINQSTYQPVSGDHTYFPMGPKTPPIDPSINPLDDDDHPLPDNHDDGHDEPINPPNNQPIDQHKGHDHGDEIIVRTFDTSHGHIHEKIILTPEQIIAKKNREKKKAETLVICRDLAEKYKIEPMLAWGNADLEIQQKWKQLDCDTLIGVADYDKYLKDNPSINQQPIVVDPARKGPILHTKVNQSIAICVCTTTRGMTVNDLTELSLFNQLVPSIVDHIEHGFEYWLYIAYDKGDAFFDNQQNLETVKQFLQTNMLDAVNNKFNATNLSINPSINQSIHIGFTLERFENVLRKPGPAFNFLTHLSYIDGATYIYRINDDSSFASKWAHQLTSQLWELAVPINQSINQTIIQSINQSIIPSSFPVGAVGPLCREGNTAILTHDFVHRVHHEIFETFHYPPSLVDWWMDDWITRVYGRNRTTRVDDVIVKHATSSHGTRYSVDQSHAKLLDAEIERGRFQIEKWLIDHDVDEKVIQQYQQDEFHFHFR